MTMAPTAADSHGVIARPTANNAWDDAIFPLRKIAKAERTSLAVIPKDKEISRIATKDPCPEENDHTASTFHICHPKFCSSSMHPLPHQLGDIACTEDKVINCKKMVARNDNDNRSCDWIALSCPNLALERARDRSRRCGGDAM